MKFNESAPLYLQVIDDIKSKIVSGYYEPGQRIDSVRDMASSYGINPNTIQKALSECENQQLLYNEGPNGRYITQDVDLIEQLKVQQIEYVVKECVRVMKRYGLSTNEMIEHIRKLDTKEKER